MTSSNSTPRCRQCNVEMQHGFVADRGHRPNTMLQRWSVGDAAGTWFSGEVARRQVTDGLKVLTFRCPRGGYLESYAPLPEEMPQSIAIELR